MLTMRQELILMTLEKLHFASRQQIQHIHELGSDRNAQRVMKSLQLYTNVIKRREGYVYYLNKKGRDYVGATEKVTKSGQVEHALLRNEIYILYSQPDTWKIEDPIEVNGKTFLIPDVKFKMDGTSYLVEVDRHQTMRNNKLKIDKYAEIKKHIPLLIWIIENEKRKPKLEEYLNQNGLNYYVVSKKDLDC